MTSVLAIAVFAVSSAIDSRARILVYVGNETAPTPLHGKTVELLADWLSSSVEESDRFLGWAVREDLKIFPAAVAAERRSIETRADRLDGAIIATNRLLQEGRVLVKADRVGPFRHEPFEVSPTTSELEKSSPLSNRANLDSLLTLVGRNFNTSQADLVFVIHSHGDELYSLTPRIGLQSEGLSRDEFMDRVHGSSSAFVERFGIQSETLMEMFADHHRREGLRISLLVLHSCESTIKTVPPGVDMAIVAAGGGQLLHDSIDYDEILSAETPELRAAFLASLVPSKFEIANEASKRHRTILRAQSLVRERGPFFIPLAFWIAVALGLRRRRGSQTTSL